MLNTYPTKPVIPAGHYVVKGHEMLTFEKLSDCKSYAGALQFMGVHHSLVILQDGVEVDLKRF